MIKVKYLNLLDFTKKILKKYKLNNFSVNAVAHGLCYASLRGVDSHGINLLPHYPIRKIRQQYFQIHL